MGYRSHVLGGAVVDHGRLLRNPVAWTANEAPPVEVEGPGVLDVTIWRQRESVAVHLVNLTNPMMMKGPVREILPIGSQHVRVRMPRGLHPEQVRLLTAGTQPAFDVTDGVVSMTVPSIDVHEVIAIDIWTARLRWSPSTPNLQRPSSKVSRHRRCTRIGSWELEVDMEQGSSAIEGGWFRRQDQTHAVLAVCIRACGGLDVGRRQRPHARDVVRPFVIEVRVERTVPAAAPTRIHWSWCAHGTRSATCE